MARLPLPEVLYQCLRHFVHAQSRRVATATRRELDERHG